MIRTLLILMLAFGSLAARNPFTPIEPRPKKEAVKAASPQDYNLSQITLKAVLWGTDRPLALFEAEDGRSFIVKPGTKIGKSGGKVTRIDDKIVIVTGSFGKRIFRILGSS